MSGSFSQALTGYSQRIVEAEFSSRHSKTSHYKTSINFLFQFGSTKFHNITLTLEMS